MEPKYLTLIQAAVIAVVLIAVAVTRDQHASSEPTVAEAVVADNR